VRAIRCRDHDEIEILCAVPEAGSGLDDGSAGVSARGRSLSVSVGGNDERQLKPGRDRDERCVKGLAGEAVANESHTDWRFSRL